MATRFAISTGNWSNTAIWDNGALPASDDVIHANGFTVTLDQDITVGSLRNTLSSIYLPNMSIPIMIANITPGGTAFAGQNDGIAFRAFDNISTTLWTSINLTDAFVGCEFLTSKVIKRYYINRTSTTERPKSWTFEGSNDGITYTILDTVVSNTLGTPFVSSLLAITTAYTYYRLNVSAVNGGGAVRVYAL